jgi:hypothetical protein
VGTKGIRIRLADDGLNRLAEQIRGRDAKPLGAVLGDLHDGQITWPQHEQNAVRLDTSRNMNGFPIAVVESNVGGFHLEWFGVHAASLSLIQWPNARNVSQADVAIASSLALAAEYAVIAGGWGAAKKIKIPL